MDVGVFCVFHRIANGADMMGYDMIGFGKERQEPLLGESINDEDGAH